MQFTSLSKQCYTIKNDVVKEIVLFSRLESVENNEKQLRLIGKILIDTFFS